MDEKPIVYIDDDSLTDARNEALLSKLKQHVTLAEPAEVVLDSGSRFDLARALARMDRAPRALEQGRKNAGLIASGKAGGMPIEKLSATERRRLTSHGAGHRTNSEKPHQGNREMERRRKRMEASQNRNAAPIVPEIERERTTT